MPKPQEFEELLIVFNRAKSRAEYEAILKRLNPNLEPDAAIGRTWLVLCPKGEGAAVVEAVRQQLQIDGDDADIISAGFNRKAYLA